MKTQSACDPVSHNTFQSGSFPSTPRLALRVRPAFSCMRDLWIACVLGFIFGGVGAVAQPPPITLDPSLTGATSPQPGWLKNFTIQSFGYSSATTQEFAFSPGYFSALFNLQGLECPRCILGPVTRPRFTLPPFGALATLKLHNDRVELFTGFGGIEAWKPDGTFEPRGRSLWTNSYGDAWLMQAQGGVRVALDRQQHFSVGATGRHLYNYGSGPQQWSTFSGDVMFKLGR